MKKMASSVISITTVATAAFDIFEGFGAVLAFSIVASSTAVNSKGC